MTSTAAGIDDRLARLLRSDPDLLQNPFPLLREIRETAPVHRMGRIVFVSRYDDVKSILTDDDRFSARALEDGSVRDVENRATLTAERCPLYDKVMTLERNFTFHADADEHDRRRDATKRLFTAGRVKHLEESAQRYVDELLDEWQGDDVFDLGPATAKLPGWIIADLLGIAREDSELLVEWGDAIALNLHGTSALEEAAAAVDGIDEYLERMLAETRAGRPVTPLFGALVEATQAAGDGRLTATFAEMQIGGYETTRSLLSNGVAALMTHRDQWERLVEEPELAANAVEELLRWVSPGLWTARVPLTDLSIRDVELTPDDMVLPLLGAADRDPETFQEPDELDLGRRNARQNLTFGFGRHYCLGQALARLEGVVFFRTLAERHPRLEHAGGELRVEGHVSNRRVTRLLVRGGR